MRNLVITIVLTLVPTAAWATDMNGPHAHAGDTAASGPAAAPRPERTPGPADISAQLGWGRKTYNAIVVTAANLTKSGLPIPPEAQAMEISGLNLAGALVNSPGSTKALVLAPVAAAGVVAARHHFKHEHAAVGEASDAHDEARAGEEQGDKAGEGSDKAPLGRRALRAALRAGKRTVVIGGIVVTLADLGIAGWEASGHPSLSYAGPIAESVLGVDNGVLHVLPQVPGAVVRMAEGQNFHRAIMPMVGDMERHGLRFPVPYRFENVMHDQRWTIYAGERPYSNLTPMNGLMGHQVTYQQLHDLGVNTIISFNAEDAGHNPDMAQGFDHAILIPVTDNHPPTAPHFADEAQVAHIVLNPQIYGNVYMHCEAGAGRTDYFVAVSEIVTKGMTPQEATQKYPLITPQQTAQLQKFYDAYHANQIPGLHPPAPGQVRGTSP